MLKDIHKLAVQKKLIHKLPFIPYELARVIAHFNRNFKQATEYVQESIAIQKSLGFGWNKNPEPWYHAHSLLGKLLMQQYAFEEAISALQICVELDKALSIKPRLAHSLNLLAKANFGNKSYNEAIGLFAESQIIVDQVRTDPELQLDNMKWFVITTWYKGEYKDALYMEIEYVNHCFKYGREPELLQIVQEHDLIKGLKVADLIFAKNAILILPSQYNLDNIQEWANEIEVEHPEMGKLGVVLAQPTQEAKSRRSRKRKT
jgi:hypothetical protein